MRLHWDVTKAGGTIICGGAEVREQLVGTSHRAPNPFHLPPMDFRPSRALRGRSALFLLQSSTIPRWMPQSCRTGQGPSHYSVFLAYGQRDDADRTYLWFWAILTLSLRPSPDQGGDLWTRFASVAATRMEVECHQHYVPCRMIIYK